MNKELLSILNNFKLVGCCSIEKSEVLLLVGVDPSTTLTIDIVLPLSAHEEPEESNASKYNVAGELTPSFSDRINCKEPVALSLPEASLKLKGPSVPTSTFKSLIKPDEEVS